MKKTIITLILLSLYPSTFAAWACLIKDQTAPIIVDYIKNNRVIIKNITKDIVKNANKKDDEKIKEQEAAKTSFDKKVLNIKNKFKDAWEKLTNEWNEISSIFNDIFNFTGYHSYFKYYVNFPLFNEVPFQVKRDYAKLDKENKWLVEYIKKINQKWETNIIIENPCKGISKGMDACKEKLKWKKTGDIIWKLIKNNDLILDLYRLTIIWETSDTTISDLLLVDNNFILDLNKYYGKKSVSACNEEKEWFFKQITDAIKDIKLLNKQSEDWIKKWKDAYALLIWNKPDEAKKIEQSKLRKYLNDKWIPSDKQAILNKNLEAYNSEWFSLNNNFIENSYNSTLKKTKKDWELWKKQNIWDTIPKWTKQINTALIKNVTSNAKITQNIQSQITTLYVNEIPFAAAWDIHTESLRSKIINSHLNLQDSINVLEKTIEVSQKVCRSQWWWWKCN